MGSLLVRNIDDSLVVALKKRAGQHGVSAEAEHRMILESVLKRPQRKSFSEAIQAIPDVGQDDDFVRRDDERESHVSD